MADRRDRASTGGATSPAGILSVPARVELPAARMAQTAPLLAIDGTRPASLGDLTFRVTEDHPATDRLKDSHHGDRKLRADVPRAVLDDGHRAVLEVSDRLCGLLALLDNAHRDLLARQD